MKISSHPLILAVLVTATAHAGPESLVKQRAKDVRDQNDARQGIPAAPPPAQPAGPQASEASRPTAAKRSAAAKLKSDLTAWQTQKPVKAEARQEFASDLQSAVRGSKSPSTSSLKKFSESLAEALGGKNLGSADLSKLVENINLALNSASLSEERTGEIAAAVQAVLENAGVGGSAATTPVTDLKAVMDELRY